MANPSANRTPALYSSDEIARAREVDIYSTVAKRLKLTSDGKLFRACCPFHNEKTASFTIDPRKNSFHCFGCGAHGGVVQFIMGHDKLSFHEAIEHLIGPPGHKGAAPNTAPVRREYDEDFNRKRLFREAEDAKDRERRIKGAQREALGIIPMTDPRAKPVVDYLIFQRGADPFALADAAARYGKDIGFHPDFHPSDKIRFISWPALCAVLRDDAGQITAIQGTRLDLETCRAVKKDGKTVRLTRGVMAGACVRIAGSLPGWLKPILTDGLDKGIIANIATGRPVLVAMGGIPRLAETMPNGSAFTISVDHDFKEPAAGKKTPQEILEETCAAAHARDCRVSLISPAIRTAEDGAKLKTDWDDVARIDGFPQVAVEIRQSLTRWFPAGHQALTDAEAKKQAKSDRFADALEELASQEAMDLPLGEAALAAVADEIVEAMEEIARRKATLADLETAATTTAEAYKSAAAHRRSFRGVKGQDAKAGRAAAKESTRAALQAAKDAKAKHAAATSTLAADTKNLTWVRLINATLGAGKSRMIGSIVARLPTNLNIGVAVADRPRIDETVKSLAAAVKTHRVLPIYGRDQQVGTAPMCAKTDLAKQVQANGKSIQSKLCKAIIATENGEKIEEFCPFYETCRYQAQISDKEPAIRVFAHNYLELTTASPLPPFDLIFIDEDPTKTLTHKGDYSVPLTIMTEVGWIATAMEKRALANTEKNRISPKNQADIASEKQSITDYTNLLFSVLNSPNPTPAKLLAAETVVRDEHGTATGTIKLSAEIAGYMSDMWYSAVDDLDITPAMPEEQQRKALSDYLCGVGYKCGRLWKIIKHTLETPEIANQNCIPGLDIVTETQGTGPNTIVFKTVYMLWSTIPETDCPIVILDGTANRTKAGQFFSGLTETVIRIKPQHTKIIQITDRPLSKTALGYGLGKGEHLKIPRKDELIRAKNTRARAARLFETLVTTAVRPDGENPLGTPWDKLAVICQKDVGEAIRAEHAYLADLGVAVGYERSDGKQTGHHGASRGTNVWEKTPILCALGRIIPPREALEREARAIWWSDPMPWMLQGPGAWEKKTAWITVKGEGRCPVMNPWHPDPRVRILLDQYLRAELEQEIHRVRPIRRTAENPAVIYICTDIATSLEVDEITTWTDLVPDEVDLILSRGVVPTDWLARALVLADMLRTTTAKNEDGEDEEIEVKDPAAALRNRAQRDTDLAEAFRQASTASVTNPNNDHTIGVRDTTADPSFAAYRYRIAGRSKGFMVLIDLRHADHRAAAEKYLGPLDRFEKIEMEEYLSLMAGPLEPEEETPAPIVTPEPPADWEAATAVPDEAYVGFVVEYAPAGPPDPYPD